MKPRFLLAFLPAFAAASLPGAVVVAYVAEATDGALAGQSSDPRLTGATVTRGADLAPVDDFAGYFDSSNWSQSSVFPGVESGSRLSFSFEVDPGYLWVPDSLRIAYQDAGSADSARRLDLRHSGDGFQSSLFLDTSISAFPGPNDVNFIDLSNLEPLSGTVEFRLYGYGALSAAGVLGLANDPALDIDGTPHALVITGDLVVIPEPRLWALLPVLLAVGVFLCRRALSGK
ncbi:MAG: hypothetical protein JJU00_04195 [Opitutales bacterium]|nr:hypothetical protein [Opitutales bacterium]